MISLKYMFILCVGAVLLSMLLTVLPNGIELNLWTAVAIGVVLAANSCIGVLYLERKKLGYRLFVKNMPASGEPEVLGFLNIERLTPEDDYILVESGGRFVGHVYARIIDVPYLIDDLDREKKLWYVGNFARILSTLNFNFEIIPRMMPVSTDQYLGKVNREIEDLRLTISSEGSVASPAREARLRHLEKLMDRLLTGEGVRDVGFLAHIVVEGRNPQVIERSLGTDMHTMISALESGLGVRVQRLRGHEMQEVVQEFFRASSVAGPMKTCRMMAWDIAYLVPFTRPKIPPVEKLIGGVYLGRLDSGAIVCLDLEGYANPHVVVLGKSGFGKSTTVKTLISRMRDLDDTPILVIDYAGEYLEWIESRSGTVIDMSRDRINPFELGGASLVDRIRQVSDAFEVVCEFGTINQRNLFRECLDRVYRVRGFDPERRETWENSPPTLSDVISMLKADLKGARMQRQQTIYALLSRLEVLAAGPFGIYGESTISIRQLTRGLSCVDLSRVSSNMLKDMVAWTVLQYLDVTMRMEGVTNKLRLVVVIDEAWKLCRDENSLATAIIKEGRKYGYSLVVSTQDTNDLAEPILSNAGTLIVHRTDFPKYLSFFKRACDLTESELSRLRNLGIGEALVKLSVDPRPFFMKVEMEEPETDMKTLTKEEPAETRFYYGKQANISKPFLNNEEISASVKADLSDAEKEMLRAVSEGNAFSTVDLYRRLGFNQRVGNQVKDKLMEKSLIMPVKIPKIAGKGRMLQGLVLTENGTEAATRAGIAVKRLAGRHGGIVHRYLIEAITEELQARGFRFEKECPIGEGQSVDVLVNGTVAVEVETGESDIRANVEKVVKTGLKLVVVCVDKNTKSAAQQETAALEDISVLSVGEVLRFIESLREGEH